MRQALNLIGNEETATSIWTFGESQNVKSKFLEYDDGNSQISIQLCDLSQALRQVADASVDMIYIYCLNTSEPLVERLTLWLSKLSPQAVLLVRGVSGNFPSLGAWKLALSFPHGLGLTLYQLATGALGAANELFQAANEPKMIGTLASFFAWLDQFTMPVMASDSFLTNTEENDTANRKTEFIYIKDEIETVTCSLNQSLPNIVPPSRMPFHPLTTAHNCICQAGEGSKRVLLFLTHVLPYPPRAGNEYRMDRLFSWLQAVGYTPVLLVSSFAGCSCDTPKLQATLDRYPNVIVQMANGDLAYKTEFPALQAALLALAGRQPRDFTETIGEAAAPDERGRRLLCIERAFCSDGFIELLLAIVACCDPVAILASYVFMSRCLSVLGGRIFKIVDTHDVFSSKVEKVMRYGIENDIPLTTEEEAAMLTRADLAVAIQPEEERELRAMCPGLATVTAGVDFDFPEYVPPPSDLLRIVYIGSGNSLNCKGLRDFQRFAWPIVKRRHPRAELYVVGDVGTAVYLDNPSIIVCGPVADLDPVYASARVVINPSIAGTGLKIKTLEALIHGRPIVLWPSGVDGMDACTRQLCQVAGDWFDFAEKVVALLEDTAADDHEKIFQTLRGRLCRETVYAALGEALRQGICRKRGQEPEA